MKIFGLSRKYRDFGIGYGLPIFVIEHGFTQSLDPLIIVDSLLKMGLKAHSWVILTNGIMREQGFGTLLKALKAAKSCIEVEDDGSSKTPGEVFNLVDRYVIDWPAFQFNIGSLRPMRDMLVYRGEDPSKFIAETEKESSIRVIETPDPQAIWELTKDSNIRVYKRNTLQ